MRTPLMANRASVLDTAAVGAELVVVDTDSPNVVVLELDDGGRLELDRTELAQAIEMKRAA